MKKKKPTKQLAFIGLGKMGGKMLKRIAKKNKSIQLYAHDISQRALKAHNTYTRFSSTSITKVIQAMDQSSKKIIWLMLPAGDITQNAFLELLPLLKKGDIIIDGGNAHYKESQQRFEMAIQHQLHFLDVGVSGGILVEKTGYPLMIGGEKKAFNQCKDIFNALGSHKGVIHVGSSGSGHYVKMIHNAIEYGMMQSLAEGFGLMHYQDDFDIDLHKLATTWQEGGTIVSSLLLKMISQGLSKHKDFRNISPFVTDNHEGRWAAQDALQRGIPFTINTTAVFDRFNSQGNAEFKYQLLSIIRNQFGGHDIQKK